MRIDDKNELATTNWAPIRRFSFERYRLQHSGILGTFVLFAAHAPPCMTLRVRWSHAWWSHAICVHSTEAIFGLCDDTINSRKGFTDEQELRVTVATTFCTKWAQRTADVMSKPLPMLTAEQ